MHFTNVRGRREIEVIHLCDTHGRDHIQGSLAIYRSASRIGYGTRTVTNNAIGFGIDFVFTDELQEPPWGHCRVGLIQLGGNRCFDFQIGPCECGALDFELQRYRSPRPLTYHAFSAAISTLGGRLQFVEFDKFHAQQFTFEAKLHIHQMNAALIVDVRPSDALVLAVICDVPVLVSNSALAALSQIRP